jgi:uncharacterized protein YndB with AHSA1/START domain
MATTSIWIAAEPDQVFDVLDDPFAYAHWVVGTRRIRFVEGKWPLPGARIHHAIGIPAAELHDSSVLVSRVRPRRLVLCARFRPAGEAVVQIDVERSDGGSLIHLTETPAGGVLSLLPHLLTEPLIAARNAWMVRRLRQAVVARSTRRDQSKS